MIFAVIDTNVIVSVALAKCSESSTPYLIFDGILNNSFTPIVDDFILDEYQEILSRTKFHFTKEKINFFINAFLKKAINEPVPKTGISLPDKDDIIFFNVAVAHQNKNAYLVSGNIKHFPNCPFAIRPHDFLEIIHPHEFLYVNEKLANYDISGLLAAMRALNEEAHQNGVAGMSEEEIEA
ncbi:MAG: putative toxin-antitoxin system toxin component, PIN family [Hallerella porci]|uniref:putative toxin-antitoxin system toxin component, PIN family n=1 Tax=Hallerella TaxID=2815788 RepID=UPI0025897338|nr:MULTISPECIES: putative toxin-antitoxin system toxin component, PIN family [Hallerella]MCI5600010.1 putative toxin-antitoxin system toxin component, PIN family [Hallerella sp.]MDY3922251.1 putative toxin-antitoxin system toxin component, PIN family [Hallerella porci]